MPFPPSTVWDKIIEEGLRSPEGLKRMLEHEWLMTIFTEYLEDYLSHNLNDPLPFTSSIAEHLFHSLNYPEFPWGWAKDDPQYKDVWDRNAHAARFAHRYIARVEFNRPRETWTGQANPPRSVLLAAALLQHLHRLFRQMRVGHYDDMCAVLHDRLPPHLRGQANPPELVLADSFALMDLSP